MFVDMRGFTRLASTLPPQELIALLGEYQRIAVPVIRAACEAARGEAKVMLDVNCPWSVEEALRIDAVVHEAWIAVGEEGTEAAAATAIAMAPMSAPAANALSPPVMTTAPMASSASKASSAAPSSSIKASDTGSTRC